MSLAVRFSMRGGAQATDLHGVQQSRTVRPGFTLIELLVVVAILAIELADVAAPGALWVRHQFTPMSGAHEITVANAGMRQGFALKSRVSLSPQPGVADFRR